MTPRVLLVNPPVYDFTAYDFWLKPYGMLSVAGRLRGRAELHLFDYMDRLHPALEEGQRTKSGEWGRGKFHSVEIERPEVYRGVERRYHRWGVPCEAFQTFIEERGPFDFCLVQTVMTYWYPGVREVIDDVRRLSPACKIVLGGAYATLCPQHARSLGPDLVIEGLDAGPLWEFLGVAPNQDELPLYDLYPALETGVLKLSDGCPFRCTYCSVPSVYPRFESRGLSRSIREFKQLVSLGARNIAFYDDALLYKPDEVLLPFLDEIQRRGHHVNLHTPNALNARFITREIAGAMVSAGFRTFYLGFESSADGWQKKHGAKVYSHELERAMENLRAAGADLRNATAYLIFAHPHGTEQNVRVSMEYAHSLGLRVMLSEFSPIPGTPDGEACRGIVDLDEPLMHNKSVFPLIHLGRERVREIKDLCRSLNSALAV
ncbi:radical SAM protein [Candidatus Sumerlaeota bacterium]|nr:radical SAM protein [Candidatus Sumerlaeota bacterium]